MIDALEKVRDVRELPLFPLSVVLFPGTPMPLHIFEPRYRRLLADVQAGNGLFGLSYFGEDESGSDRPPLGHLGCVAEVRDVQEMPDGRSNILSVGVIRYRLDEYVVTDQPYLIGRVSFFSDEVEDEAVLLPMAVEVLELFMRIARAIRTVNDDRSDLPELPGTDPEHLSFLVSAAIELEDAVKLELLELRSTSERLQRLRGYLARVVDGYEYRAKVHGVAKTNGHGAKNIILDE
jgi:ATP-dependent Lon protease